MAELDILFTDCSGVGRTIACNGMMVDLLHLFTSKTSTPYTYTMQNKSSEYLTSLNSGQTHVQISSYTIKEKRFSTIQFGFPFKYSQDFIFTKLPKIQVKMMQERMAFHVGARFLARLVFIK